VRAAYFTRVGPAREVLEVGEVPDAVAGPGQVRVLVTASGINPADVKRRAGMRGELPFPLVVPHDDGAGVIDAVGEGVPTSRIGERVWVYDAQLRGAFGTAAEAVAVPVGQAVPLPAGTGFDTGACLGVPAVTAHRCVHADGPVAGTTVLVQGATGAVGLAAAQLARRGGARVLVTAGSREKLAALEARGFLEGALYGEIDVGAWARDLTGGAGVDRVIDAELGVNLARDAAAVRAGGVIVAYGSALAPEPALPVYALLGKGVVLRFVLVYLLTPEQRAAANTEVTDALEDGSLAPLIGARFALEDIVAAHEAVEAGSFGQVVVEVQTA
jgi:NADPH2:quinone reductase